VSERIGSQSWPLTVASKSSIVPPTTCPDALRVGLNWPQPPLDDVLTPPTRTTPILISALPLVTRDGKPLPDCEHDCHIPTPPATTPAVIWESELTTEIEPAELRGYN